MGILKQSIVAATLLMVGTSSSLSAAATCYATSDDKAEVYILDVNSGNTASILNISKTFETEGAAYRASDNKLYIFSKTGVLNSIDLVTGVAIDVIDLGINAASAEFYNGILYATTEDPAADTSVLYAFDTKNNWSTVAGYPITMNRAISGLAIDSNGNAYAMDDYDGNSVKPTLLKINLADGTLSNPVELSELLDAEGLSFGSDNKLYTEDERHFAGPVRKIYEIDTSTGAVTEVGALPAVATKDNDIEAVACNVGASGVVIPTKTAPVANDDEDNCTSGSATAVTVAVLNNDSDADNDINSSSVEITSAGASNSGKTLTVANGEWNVQANGDIIFTPSANCTQAPDPISYTVTDNTGKVSNEASVTIKSVNNTFPTISIADAQLLEENTTTPTMVFTLTLSEVSTSDVSVDYTLSDGSATVANNDYVDGTDTITISAGQKTATIDVQINGDETFEPNETFTVTLNTPVDVTILDGEAIGTIINDDISQGTSTVPTTVDDEHNCTAGTTTMVTIPVLSNDRDPENDIDVTTVVITSAGATDAGKTLVVAEGTWNVLVNGDVTFTPDANCTTPPAPITYTVTDDTTNVSNPANITIRVPSLTLETDSKTNRAIVNTSGSVDILDLSGANAVDYRIVSLPTVAMGILYMADGITEVQVDDILTQTQANGLKFNPDGQFTGNALFTYASRNSKGTEDTTPATVTIPVVKTAVLAATTTSGCVGCSEYKEDGAAALSGFSLLLMFLISTVLGLFLTRRELEEEF